VLNVVRPSDGVLVNPWRWVVTLALVSGAAHLCVGMACHFRVVTLGSMALHGGVGRVIAGIALLTLPGSGIFWVLAATALALSLVSVALVHWKYDRVAGAPGLVATATVWHSLLALAAHSVLFLGSNEVFAWFTYDVTIVASAVADALLFLLPAVYLMTEAYYKGGHGEMRWPLLPRFVYDDYGVGHYWKGAAKPQLIALIRAAKGDVVVEVGPAAQGDSDAAVAQ